MKKLIALIAVFGFFTFGLSNIAFAQEAENPAQTEQAVDSVAADSVAPVAAVEENIPFVQDNDDAARQSLHYAQAMPVWHTCL